MMHASLDEHRQLQRRLSMLNALQAETIKLEKKNCGSRGVTVGTLDKALASPAAAR
jgi:hypothetical protein